MAIVGTGLSTAGIRAEFFQRLAEVQKQTHWEGLTTRLQARTKKEQYRFLGQVPPMREWKTGRLARGVFSESYDVEDLKYESTLEVDREELEDDQFGQIRLRISEMADRAATHKDSLVAALLENGATAGFNSYDGLSFFNDAHVSGKSGSQDNDITTSIVDKDNPTAAEFRSALRDAITTLLGFKDDQGEPMSFGATGLVCVVPPSMLITVSEAINATLVDQGSTNILSGAARIIALPHLTSTDK